MGDSIQWELFERKYARLFKGKISISLDFLNINKRLRLMQVHSFVFLVGKKGGGAASSKIAINSPNDASMSLLHEICHIQNMADRK